MTAMAAVRIPIKTTAVMATFVLMLSPLFISSAALPAALFCCPACAGTFASVFCSHHFMYAKAGLRIVLHQLAFAALIYYSMIPSDKIGFVQQKRTPASFCLHMRENSVTMAEKSLHEKKSEKK